MTIMQWIVYSLTSVLIACAIIVAVLQSDNVKVTSLFQAGNIKADPIYKIECTKNGKSIPMHYCTGERR